MPQLLKQGAYFGNLDKQVDHKWFSISITSYQGFESIEPHQHSNPYISLLLKGSYREENEKDSTVIKTGQAVIRPAGYVHANVFDSDSLCFNVEWKPLTWSNELELMSFSEIRPASDFFSLQKLVAAQFHDVHLSLQTEWVLDLLKVSISGTEFYDRTPWIKELMNIVRLEMDRFHSLQSLSEKLHIHPIYMARAFKQKTGFTIGEFQLEVKLSYAAMLLYQKKLPVFKVAQRTGFYDVSHLVKSFRLYYGTTPRKFSALLKG